MKEHWWTLPAYALTVLVVGFVFVSLAALLVYGCVGLWEQML